jgi:uncharacterized membrane protein YdjX (TVP38/TMEM64 family)
MLNHLKKHLISNNFLADPHNIVRVILIIVIISMAIFISINYTIVDVYTYLQENPKQTIAISLLIYISFGLTFLPSIPLTLFIAVLIGPLQAAIVATVGNTIAALLEYQVGKTIGDAVDFEGIKSKLPFGLGKLPIHSPYFLLAARSIPAGTRGFSMVCGAYQVPMISYLWTTSTMYFFSSLFLAYGGAELIKFI